MIYKITRLSFLFVLSALCSSAYAGVQDKGYTIKIKVKGIKDSRLLLANYYADKQYLRDSAVLDAKGYYVFKGKEKLEQGLYTVAGESKVKYFDIVVDDVQNMTLETDTSDFNKQMKITGSAENAYFFEYLKFMQLRYEELTPYQDLYRGVKNRNKDSADMLMKKMTSIDSSVKEFKKNFIVRYPSAFFSKVLLLMQEPEIPEAPKNADGSIDSTFAYKYYKAHYWDKVDLADDRLLRTPLFTEKLKKYFDNIVLQQPDSVFKEANMLIEKTKGNKEMFKYLVIFTTNRSETSDIMGMDAAFVYMAKKYYATGKAYWVDSTTLFRINDRVSKLEPILIGKQAPPLNLADSTLARFISLYSVKATYTVVVFWDPSCGHCQKEIPKLVEEYDKMLKAGMDVKIYSVCSSSQVEEWKKYIKEKKHDKFINVIDHDISRKNYDITSTPQFFILDANKKIIAKRLVSEQLEDFLKRYSEGQNRQIRLRNEEE